VPDFLVHWIATYGVAAIFALLLLGVFGLPIPDETLLTFAGVLVRQGRLHLIPTLIAAWLGAVCGITISYALGRTLGAGFVHRYGGWLHVTQEDAHRVEQWLEHSGRWTLMFGYYIPGVRHLTAIVAGSTELPRRTFARYAYAGAGIWSVSFISLGMYVGKRWEAALHLVHQHIAISVIVLAVPGIAYVFVHRWWMRRHRNRS
jgi:membrane protein DedA with SNARE-associated domain